MTGLEKIVDNIRSDVNEAVSDILSEAEEKAWQIRKGAEEDAAKEVNTILTGAKNRAEDIRQRSQSAADLRCRQKVLGAKQEMISEAMDKALEAAASLPDEEYFAMILKMAAGAAHPGETGTIRFGKKDLARLPKDFAGTLEKALTGGSTLTVSEEPCDVDSGFVLSYKGIEENCSFASVLSSRKEEIQDKVRQILFG